jgi:hypothetical protein
MKRQLIFLAVYVAALSVARSQSPSVQPKAGFVPNAETAIKVCEAVLIPVYGEKQILSERPFKATLKGDVWTVDGTVPCAEPERRCPSGAAEGKISKRTGQILHMIHYQ